MTKSSLRPAAGIDARQAPSRREIAAPARAVMRRWKTAVAVPAVPHPAKVAAAAALCALFLAGCLTARGARATPPVMTQISGDIPTSGTTFAPSQRVLVRTRAGRLYIGYIQSIGGVDQVFVARSDDSGATWSVFPQISTGDDSSSNPDLVAGPDGTVVVFWTRRVRASTPSAGESPCAQCGAGQVREANGELPGDESAELESDTAGRAENADAEIEEAEESQEPEEKQKAEDSGEYRAIRQLFVSVYDGATWSPQDQLTSGTYNGFPSAAFDSRGVLHLVWYGYDGSYYQVEYEMRRNGAWTEPDQISQGYPDSVNPTVAVDSHDNLFTAWYKFSRATKAYQINYREYFSANHRWAEEDDQISQGLFNATNVSTAVGPDDTVYAVWEGIPVNHRGSGIYLRELSSGTWSGQIQVAPPSLNAHEPSAAIDAAGDICIFYEDGARNIRFAVYHGTSLRATRALTDDARNGYANARWSEYGQPAGADGVDVAWTVLGAHPGSANPNLIHVATIRP